MSVPAHVQGWIDFLSTVDVRGPIRCRFNVHQDDLGKWHLLSEMLVPERDGHLVGEDDDRRRCSVAGYPMEWIAFENALPAADDPTPREDVIRQRVLAMYQHEALESILIDGRRTFDPHDARWYSNLVVDWRFTR